MKTLFISTILCIQVFLGLAQIAQTKPSLLLVPVGCYNDKFAQMAYSSEETDKLLETFLNELILVKGSKIIYSEKDGFLLTAMVELEGGWGNVALLLEKSGRILNITENSCAHICMSDPNKPCRLVSEIVSFVPCMEVFCQCLGDGKTKSKVIIGNINKLQKSIPTISRENLCN